MQQIHKFLEYNIKIFHQVSYPIPSITSKKYNLARWAGFLDNISALKKKVRFVEVQIELTKLQY